MNNGLNMNKIRIKINLRTERNIINNFGIKHT